MSTKEVSLPTGGRVWLRTRLTHAQASERDDAMASLPSSALGRLNRSRESGATIEIEDTDLALVTAALRHQDEATIRVCVHHSDGVRDPSGDPVDLPADMGRLDEEDYSFLVGDANATLREGFGDPNSSRASSAMPSSPGGSEETSPQSSETLS